MKEEKKKPKLIASEKIGIAILLIIILGVVILMLTPKDDEKDGNTNKTSSQTSNVNHEEVEQGVNLNKLSGFTLKSSQAGIYTYSPAGNSDFSVALTSSNENLDIHAETYPLEKSTKTINNIEVQIGYEEDYELNGTMLTNAHSSLAFDFKYEDKYYSGEISNLNGEPAKEELITILNKLILTFQN